MKNIFRKKPRSESLTSPPTEASSSVGLSTTPARYPPEFTFIRTDTSTEERLTLPHYDSLEDKYGSLASSGEYTTVQPQVARSQTLQTPQTPPPQRRARSRRTFSRTQSTSSPASAASPHSPNEPPRSPAFSPMRSPSRLSQGLDRLHIHPHSRKSSTGSIRVPADLPDIPPQDVGSDADGVAWERRAVLLAEENRKSLPTRLPALVGNRRSDGHVPGADISVFDVTGRIQEAVGLQEQGDLERSTAIFASLADPNMANDACSQVFYGLALRHGWGTPIDRDRAMIYLSLAACNAAAIESAALSLQTSSTAFMDGASKPHESPSRPLRSSGRARDELAQAIFELGNNFRHGWGTGVDAMAARTYYEVAAQMGDTDAMQEVAWCYLEGFGGAKDKSRAAGFLRRAENKAGKVYGNGWIWKEKYTPAD